MNHFASMLRDEIGSCRSVDPDFDPEFTDQREAEMSILRIIENEFDITGQRLLEIALTCEIARGCALIFSEADKYISNPEMRHQKLNIEAQYAYEYQAKTLAIAQHSRESTVGIMSRAEDIRRLVVQAVTPDGWDVPWHVQNLEFLCEALDRLQGKEVGI